MVILCILFLVNEWKAEKNITNLGVPHYVTSGSHVINDVKYRFLILPRFEKDLEEILVAKKNKFNLKTVLVIASQIIDILEYIHSKGIVHSDIKASNILLKNENVVKRAVQKDKAAIRYYGSCPVRSCRVRKMTAVKKNLRPNNNLKYIDSEEHIKESQNIPRNTSSDQVYLLDYGLASRFMKNNIHNVYGRDERKAHAGTLLFCSVDAHAGSTSRRSDLECLGYNIIYWLTGSLPWIDDIDNPELVEKKKSKCLVDLKLFLNMCFSPCPRFIYDYFKYLLSLEFEAEPDYSHLKQILKKALNDYGYKNTSKFDFDNLEGWGRKQKKTKRNSENFKVTKLIRQQFKRMPLQSNLPLKPLLRKTLKNKKKNELNWSKILLDPETILKQAKTREKKTSECNELNSIEYMNIDKLKPTYHMLNIYNRYMDKLNNANGLSPRYNEERYIINFF